MPDNRRTARRAILPGARATFEDATGNRHEVDVGNLSVGGLFLQTESPLPAGKRISLEVHVVGQPTPWPAMGRVAWVRWLSDDEAPAGMGVKIIDIDETASSAIEALVERLCPPEPPLKAPDAPPSRPRVPGAGTPSRSGSYYAPPQVRTNGAGASRPKPLSLVELAAPNLAIDLVTKKDEAPVSGVRASHLDEAGSSPADRRRGLWPWIVLVVLLASALAWYYFRRSSHSSLHFADSTPSTRSSPRSAAAGTA
jgi:uncharacterized protein (TIGR02266 family)